MKKSKFAIYVTALILAISGCEVGSNKPSYDWLHFPQIEDVASAQYSLNSTHDNPDPYDINNTADRQLISQILGWLRSAKPVDGATTHVMFSMGPSDLVIKLKNGNSVTIEPAIDSITKKLSNGSTEIDSKGNKGQVVYRQGEQAIRLEAPKLSDWLSNGWNAGEHRLPDETKYIQRIHMLDESKGWGKAIGHIFRTEDGGKTWSETARLDTQTDSSSWAESYQDINVVRILEPRKKELRVYRTSDGGKKWNTSVIKTDFDSTNNSLPHIFSFGFLNNGYGWITVGFDANQGSQFYEMYVTADNGANWRRLNAQGPHVSATGGLPLESINLNAVFTTNQCGWVAGYTRRSGIWLYQTKDGGIHWNRQDLHVPNDFVTDSKSNPTLSFKFFSATDGLLTAINHDAKHSTLFYTTHDGGKTWGLDSFLKLEGNQQAVWDFSDPEHGYVVVDENQFYTTVDGAKTWKKIVAAGHKFHYVDQLDFISSDTGWIPNGRYLLKTSDGGHTWTQDKYRVLDL
jgi:photosystem II stability/assembly factor-like uncharacterized protein